MPVAIQTPWKIPKPDTKRPPFETVVIKCAWPNDAREEIEPKMFAACAGVFGAPDVLFSFAACFRENQPMCNSIFLPPSSREEVEKHYWNV
ncbi:MAG TPA: hypothetical protein VM842_01660, partial [Nitrospira sp.]|nr:hypothetical protein [Nitrospira sp.]